MRKTRLEWAKEYQISLNDWRNVIYSDESKINLFARDGQRCVRRKSGERFHAHCVTPTVKFSTSVMIWGCMTAFGLGPLIFVEGAVNAKKSKENVLPTIEDITQYIDHPIFQDDSAPCHRAQTV